MLLYFLLQTIYCSRPADGHGTQLTEGSAANTVLYTR